MAHAHPFAFEAAPIEYARSMYRFGNGTPTIPGYVVAKPGHDSIRADRRRAHSRAQRAPDDEDRRNGARARICASTRRSNRERRTGWIGIDFDDSERVCRELIAERVFLDYRPGCGIRVSAHFYTTDGEIDNFFAILDRLR